MLMGRSFFAFRKFEGNIQKKDNYQDQSQRYLDISANFPKIHFFNFLSSHTAINKNIIPKITFKINAKKSYKFLGGVIFGPIKTLTNQAAEIFIDRAEKAFNHGLYLFFIGLSLSSSRYSLLGD